MNSPYDCLLSFDHAFLCGGRSTVFDVYSEDGSFAQTDDWPSSTGLGTFHDVNLFGQVSGQDIPIPRPDSPAISESSWTGEDENDTLFFSIERRLFNFLLSPDQTQLVLPPLNVRQRRIVHGIAHLMHLRHKTIQTTQHLRRIQISKKTAALIEGSPQTTTIGETEVPHPSSRIDSVEPSFDITTSCSERSHSSNNFASTPERTHRMPKKQGGFPCRSPDCQKTFDRACDRNKHERLHEPKSNHPHRCSQCHRSFLYPKDLRRHARTHLGKSTGVICGEDSSPDDISTNASASPFEKMNGITGFGSEDVLSSLPCFNGGQMEDVKLEQHETWLCDDFLTDLGLNSVEDWLLHSTAWDCENDAGFQ